MSGLVVLGFLKIFLYVTYTLVKDQTVIGLNTTKYNWIQNISTFLK